ncbi:hypothetical protein WN944_010247 [Citrus x changshan-huyou]|uniref:Uncharacterized protein n=1 Tax=Citrus x changshan-huyou TaxID=2935761 RepID=A0AAP0QX22_9ROSI
MAFVERFRDTGVAACYLRGVGSEKIVLRGVGDAFWRVRIEATFALTNTTSKKDIFCKIFVNYIFGNANALCGGDCAYLLGLLAFQ